MGFGLRNVSTKRDDKRIKFAAFVDEKKILTNLAKEFKSIDGKILSRRTATKGLNVKNVLSQKAQ